ncbi:MAG: Mu-like prophage major head subunit gpT family protein [Rhodospirillales bacterium]|nr:Mu-like prophage major head subunit gpT family protein [Rhodospirillales bacterium]
MVAITFPALASINDAVNLAFNSQLYAAKTLYKEFTFDATSTGAAEVYPRLDMLTGLRQWVGDRVVKSLSQETFTITNQTFEETIGVKREDIEDDRYGILTPVAQELGQNAGRLPDLLIAQTMVNGVTLLAYDGIPFFGANHPNYTNTGAPTTVANYASGSGNPSWYLLDGTRVLKPFIFQSRRPFRLVAKFSLTDPSVFFDNEFVWGVDGRCNAGLGLWQLAYRGDNIMNLASLLAARTAMATLRRPDGAPMGIGQNGLLLVVPTALYAVAQQYCTNEFDPLAATLTPNTFRGLARAIENPWLN